MRKKLNHAVKQMLIQIFRPLVKILLRMNMPFNEVSDVLKWTYVDVASQYSGINGKAPTKSRISVVTGLSRTQVDLQLKMDLFNDQSQHYKWHRAVRVLTGWIEDKDYIDQYDKPKIIPLEDASGIDFKSLVERYSGGATFRSILDDLLVSESVQVHNDMIELIKPYYVTVNDSNDLQKINFLGVSTQYLLESIDHNLNLKTKKPRFQRIVIHELMPKSLINIAESYIRDKSQKLANDVDEYLQHLIQYADDDGSDLVPYLGLGLYYYQANDKQTDKQTDKKPSHTKFNQ